LVLAVIRLIKHSKRSVKIKKAGKKTGELAGWAACLVYAGSLIGGHARQRWVSEDAPLDMLHHIERCAQHAGILAQAQLRI
jgi:hypothetical protein